MPTLGVIHQSPQWVNGVLARSPSVPFPSRGTLIAPPSKDRRRIRLREAVPPWKIEQRGPLAKGFGGHRVWVAYNCWVAFSRRCYLRWNTDLHQVRFRRER